MSYVESVLAELIRKNPAHISKATALHLLQNGLVPCKDTGKKTRRYTIRTDDIIFYLIDRELHPEVYRAPDRWYQERSGHYNSRVTYRNELTKLSEEERAAIEMGIRRFLHQGVKCLGRIVCVHCFDLQFDKKISPVIVLLCAVQ